jgi:two-component system, NarL family, nitrate/nitrite response regulator NarL
VAVPAATTGPAALLSLLAEDVAAAGLSRPGGGLPYARSVDDLRVVVVAADPLARRGLAALLGREPGLIVAGRLDADEDGVDARRDDADAAVWDLGAGPRPPLQLLTRAAEAGLPVLALVHDEDDAAFALAAGARGVLFRDASGERLAAALRAVHNGLRVLDDGLATNALRLPHSAPPALVEPLTPRESEVLQLLAQGLANKAIAERLGISDHTAKFHVNAILGKLGAQSRTEAIVHAARLGLVIL